MVHSQNLRESDPVELASIEFDALLASVENAGELDEGTARVLDFALRRRCLDALRAPHPSNEELTELSRGISRILRPQRVTQLAQLEGQFAARWLALRDLIDDRLRSAQEADPKRVLDRDHVRPALLWVHEQTCSGEDASQVDLREHLGLRKANLTRLVSLMVEHGLLTRRRVGKENQLALTEDARELLGLSAKSSTAPRGLSYLVRDSVSH